MNKKKFLATCAVFICAAFTIVFFSGAISTIDDVNAVPEIEELIIPVAVVGAQTRDIAVNSEFVGAVQPNQQVMVMPKLAGEVISVEVEAGDFVEAGAVLCRLDAESLQYTIAQTQASLANAKAKAELGLKSAQYGKEVYESNVKNGTLVELAQLEVQLASAVSGAEVAAAGVKTARRTLYDARDNKEYYTDEQMDQIKDALDRAQIQSEGAQAAVDALRKTYDAAQKAVLDSAPNLENSVKNAELNTDLSSQYIALEQLKSNLDKATITAPISGIVEKRLVEPFGIATNASPAFIISDKSSMHVSFKIPESSYSQILPGDEILVEKDGMLCSGTIFEIGTMVENSSGLLPVKAVIENPLPGIHSGSVVKLFVDIQKSKNALTLPLGAVYYTNNNIPYVFIAEDGIAVEKTVEVGIADDESIEIISGLSSTDAVITTWHTELRDGAKISLQ